MVSKHKYAFDVSMNFNTARLLVSSNVTNDACFWDSSLEDHESNNFIMFSSELLNDLIDPEEIYTKGYMILSIFQGIFNLLENRSLEKSHYPFFTLNGLFVIDENYRLYSRKIDLDIYRIDFDLTSVNYGIEPSHPIYKLYEIIINDDYLVSLFFILSRKVDYKMLYIIYDDIRYYLKEINNDPDFLSPYKKDLNNFTHTANNFEVLGYAARHGRTIHTPPSKPMTLDESKSLIFKIVQKLLKEKFSINLPL